MGIIQLVVLLAVIGFLLWLVTTYVPMLAPFPKIALRPARNPPMNNADNLIIHSDGRVERVPALNHPECKMSGCTFTGTTCEQLDELLSLFNAKRTTPQRPI